MRLIRFGEPGRERPGLVAPDGSLRDLSNVCPDLDASVLVPSGLAALRTVDPFVLPRVPAGARVGAPVPTPGKIVCIGLNYADHAAETGFDVPIEPLVFFKSPTAVSGPYDPIILPPGSTAVDWEVELAVVIGAPAAGSITEDAALAHVAGYAVANDVTERNWQLHRGGQWGKGKSADTFCPLGPWLVTPDEAGPPSDLLIWLDRNGVRRQDSSTSQMVFPVSFIVAYLTRFMSLLSGDVILTGTPPGVAFNKANPDYLAVGDVLELGVTGLGQQRCRVEAHDNARPG